MQGNLLIHGEGKMMKKEIIDWTICIIIAIVIALFIKTLIGTPTIVKQVSMYPTLVENQRLILNRASLRVAKKMPKRGEIVTLEAPSETDVSYVEANQDNPIAKYDNKKSNIFSKFAYYILEITKESYIKRVIALPGEHIQIREGKVYINDEELQEPYLQNNIITDSYGGIFTDLVVPENCVFVMGDNRANSLDSRRFGCVPLEKLEGVVWIRFWPFDVFGKI